jgi:hypothetical protein
MTSGSNWRHLNRPATEGARTISAQLPVHSCKVATLPIKRGSKVAVRLDLTFRDENPPGNRHDTRRTCHAHMARNQARLANNPGTVFPTTHRENHDYTPHYNHPDIPRGSHRDVQDPDPDNPVPDNLVPVLERYVESRCPHTTPTQTRELPTRRLRPIASSPYLTLP